jgi:hypothetical protein
VSLAIEVVILWGTNVLHVSHLTPPRGFYVGEGLACDFWLPADQLGTSRLPIVIADGGVLALVVPPVRARARLVAG